MKGRAGLLALAALLAVGAAAPLWGPHALRRVAWFQIRRVEISGTRLLAPHQVLSASGIRIGQNLWEDLDAWERALRRNPAIAEARVSRKLPHTLRIRVEEKRPVAYVELGALEPITAAGELLPLDPSRNHADLPVIRGPWKRTPPAVQRLLLQETDRIGRLEPRLIAEVSEIRVEGAAPRTLVLAHRLGEIVLPVGTGADRLVQLRAVLTDLEGRLPPADSAAAGRARVDLRFGEQIIVRLPTSA